MIGKNAKLYMVCNVGRTVKGKDYSVEARKIVKVDEWPESGSALRRDGTPRAKPRARMKRITIEVPFSGMETVTFTDGMVGHGVFLSAEEALADFDREQEREERIYESRLEGARAARAWVWQERKKLGRGAR